MRKTRVISGGGALPAGGRFPDPRAMVFLNSIPRRTAGEQAAVLKRAREGTVWALVAC
jgi:hypothetical protein